MALVKIYRVEGRDGNGPYSGVTTNSHNLQKKLRKHNSQTGRPSPHLDGIQRCSEYPMHEYYFGFTHVDKLKEWFKGSRTALRQDGYKMAVYEVDVSDVLFGKKQAAFVKKLANPIKTVKIP